jgi:hypothetical protein
MRPLEWPLDLSGLSLLGTLFSGAFFFVAFDINVILVLYLCLKNRKHIACLSNALINEDNPIILIMKGKKPEEFCKERKYKK